MIDRCLFGEPSAEPLERRWFAALAAIRSLEAESELLFEALQLADVAWRRTRDQLSEFEALRDTLEQQLSGDTPSRAAMSAA